MPRAQALNAPKLVERARGSLAEAHQRVLMRQALPSMVVSYRDEIVHLSEKAGRFLHHVEGEVSHNALAVVLPPLRLELRAALLNAKQFNTDTETLPVILQRDDKNHLVQMYVRPFHDEILIDNLLLVQFLETEKGVEQSDSTKQNSQESVLGQLEDELQRNREQFQETIEHSEILAEELRASNEELQAINEELRSATEELETSKEELQSINEELVTVNYELKAKVEETSKVNNDLNNLIASTDIATIFVDGAMRIKRYTPRATDVFNIILSDIGRSLFDITHRLDYAELPQDAANTFHTLRPVEREVSHLDGRYYIVRFLPYRTVEDKIDGAVLTFIDITSRRQAQEQKRVSDERMSLLAESTRDYAILSLDVAGNIASWNTGAERIFGYTEAEIIGLPAATIFTEQDRVQGVPEDEMRRAREDGRAEDERWHLRKNGTTFYCSGVMMPLGEGALRGYAKIARDQTDRMTEHQSRLKALGDEHAEREKAEISSAAKDEFFAVMSHELRHPLNLIHINAELLARLPEIKRSSISTKATAEIRNAVVSQAKIIDDLLDMSRLNTGKLALAIASIDLTNIVNDLAATVRADPASAMLDIVLTGCNKLMMVRVDQVRTEQVLMNLVGNAIKFTAHGAITIAVTREGEFARLDVTDTGQGIASDFVAHVFDMYGQGHTTTTRSKGGLGIGLALVKQIAELQGGKVAAESAGLGAGAKFSVWFPLCHSAGATGENEIDALENSLQGLRLLLVDDSEDIVMSFQALLEMAGATAHIATSAKKALAILQTTEVDVLVSDISMPDIDGYAFLQAVRKMPACVALPAIAVTGLDRKQDTERAYAAGFNAHLSKPMSIEALVASIQGLLRSESVE